VASTPLECIWPDESVLLVSIAVPLLVVAVAVPLFGRVPTFLLQSTGLDSPRLYLRFVVLSVVLGAVMLAVFHLVSAVSNDEHRGLAAMVGVLLLVVFGFDIASVIGLSVGGGATSTALAVLSPNGAYRTLVLELVVAPVTDPTSSPHVDIAASIGVLFAWTLFSLGPTGLLVWNRVDT